MVYEDFGTTAIDTPTRLHTIINGQIIKSLYNTNREQYSTE